MNPEYEAKTIQANYMPVYLTSKQLIESLKKRKKVLEKELEKVNKNLNLYRKLSRKKFKVLDNPFSKKEV